MTFFAKRAKLDVMSKRSKQKTTEEGEQMVMTGFRILPSDLVRAKQKVGLVALSKYLRALFLMWLNNEIVISEKDVEKYN